MGSNLTENSHSAMRLWKLLIENYDTIYADYSVLFGGWKSLFGLRPKQMHHFTKQAVRVFRCNINTKYLKQILAKKYPVVIEHLVLEENFYFVPSHL